MRGDLVDNAAGERIPRIGPVDDIRIGHVTALLAGLMDGVERRRQARHRGLQKVLSATRTVAQEESPLRPVHVRPVADAELVGDGREGILRGRVEPVGALVEGNAGKARGVGIGPPADASAGLEDDDGLARPLQRQSRGKASGPRSDDGDVVVAHGLVTRLKVRLIRPPSFSRVELPVRMRSTP